VTKYVIHYKINGERRWDFAHLQTGSLDEAKAALAAIHGDSDEQITEIRISKAL
jgi:hypothetical protein